MVRADAKIRMVFPARLAVALAALCITPTGVGRAADPPELRYQVQTGLNLDSFVRQGPVAADVVLRSGADPRILVAFPAGDSGVAVWFAHSATPPRWRLAAPPVPLTRDDARGRPLSGVAFTVEARAPDLAPARALLTSVRVLRAYPDLRGLPASLLIEPTIDGDTLTWARDRIDGAPGYRLTIEVIHGSLQDGRLVAGADGEIGLRIEALTGEPPLTPLSGDQLLNAAATPDIEARQGLSFLSYRQKLLAGSWKFDTYFGRDTLLTLRLMSPVLQPPAVEDGLRSVVARLSPTGEVAHEEAIGEFAILDHLKAGEAANDAPVFDYGMIDETLLLAPDASAWLLDDPRGRARAAAFLASPSGRPGESVGAALMRNFRLVVAETRPFAEDPRIDRLLALKPGHAAGQWRDSGTGLGGGRYPFDVNAVFAPAALEAIGRLSASGLLDPYESADDRRDFAAANGMARAWRTKAPRLFEVQVPAAAAREAVRAFARDQGVPAAPALAALAAAGLAFHALALGADGAPVKVVHSDESFDLLFGAPDPASLDLEVAAMMRPFPAGLMTGAGLLVANPVFAPPAMQALFPRTAYHGEVVWSWQQALLAAGLERELARTDLPPAVRTDLRTAQAQLWRVIVATRPVANDELWSWTWANGRYRVQPYAAAGAGSEEADAAQLWNTVYLAIRPPRPGSR